MTEMLDLSARPWDLVPAQKAESSRFEESTPIEPPEGFDENDPESVFANDKRTPVKPQDFAPGGKYRSIVKLQLGFQSSASSELRWCMGTGWLIADDILVTAGHCVFSHSGKLGRVKQAVAYIGYTGRDTIRSPNVQIRHGVRAVTTQSWIATSDNRSFDVGFLKLNKPFTGVKPFKFETTPEQGTATIGVVGYPGDKINPKTNEKGYQMYEEFAKARWNLGAANPAGMLKYRISTYPGQSGSPVIKQGTNISIGIHVYGAGADKANGATPIGASHSISFKTYVDSLSSAVRPSPAKPRPSKPTPGKPGTSKPKPRPNIPEKITNGDGSEDFPEEDEEDDDPNGEFDDEVDGETDEVSDESFRQALEKVIKVGGPLTDMLKGKGTPFLGHAGKAASALAYISLGVAGNIANKFKKSGAGESEGEEAEEQDSSVNEGLICRGILGQAALETIFKMDHETFESLNIMEKLRTNYKPLGGPLLRLPTHLLRPLTEKAFRITLEHQAKTPNGEPKLSRDPQPLIKPTKTETIFDEDEPESDLTPESEFESALESPTPLLEGGEEFFPLLLPLIRTGIKYGPKAFKLLQGARHLDNNKESEPTESDDAEAADLDALTERAIFGEAALEALLTVPVDELAAESVFDSIKAKIQQLGPYVKKYGPSVIKVVKAGAQALLESQEDNTGEDIDENGDEDVEEDGDEAEATPVPKAKPAGLLRKRLSVRENLMNGGGVNEHAGGGKRAVNGNMSMNAITSFDLVGKTADDTARSGRKVRFDGGLSGSSVKAPKKKEGVPSKPRLPSRPSPSPSKPIRKPRPAPKPLPPFDDDDDDDDNQDLPPDSLPPPSDAFRDDDL